MVFKQGHFFRKVHWFFLLIVVIPFSFVESVGAQDVFNPPALYAVWTEDPTTTISITWITRGEGFKEATEHESILEYRLKEQEEALWYSVEAVHNPVPFSNRIINRADLSGLEPDTRYSFRLDPNSPDSLIYYFRTMPKKINRPITFAAGGDTRADIQFEKTNLQVMKHDPDFIMIGGDLAYENGSPLRVERVNRWLEVAKRMFITDDGRIVPIIASIGDHEGRRAFKPGFFEKKEDEAPYYYALFPFPGVPGYGVLDVGDYMSIVVLHAGFGAPIKGDQTKWLKKILKARKKVPHIFPIYHHGIYPSVRDIYKDQQTEWAPLFEKYGVKVAFENHDHAYKRTYPIREGKVVADGEGVVYLGDGSWGQLRKNIKPERWYLAKALAVRSFIIGTIQPGDERFQFKMFNQKGQLIDSYPE